ncbi:ciliogenesis and planar polarity effector 2-like isoform X2 [Rhopilema esculentum]|uniref:ciliogenesis and planar polarity effector 2-like isoform X2 n=1 Tax=Rhopilema esculentum TaxID=499914 RepID=UPI0031E36AF4
MMERTGMILQEHWLDSSDGKELFASILRRNRRRIFGLIETPNLPPKVNIEEVSYKIFLLGKAGVGKTSLVSKLVGTAIPSYHKETPGIQMSVVYWPAKLRNTQQLKIFKLIFWDAGETCLKKFDHIEKACKENADAVIYTFSLQNRTSWKDLEPLITRSEVDDTVLKLAVGTKYDQIDPKDSILEEIRNFEQAWKIPVLKIANVDGPMLPDGKSLDGRASIKEIAPFLNNLVSLLWMHDQTADEALKRSSAVITMTSSTSSGKSKISQSGVRMPVDDDYDDRSSNHSSASSSRRSVGEKLPVTYC